MELVIRVVDKVSTDRDKNAALTKRGDVISAMADGWPWTDTEKSNPVWRILRVNLTVTDADFIMDPEIETELVNKTVVRQRKRKIDLDAIAATDARFKTWLDDDTRAVPVFDFGIKRQIVADAVLTREDADVELGYRTAMAVL